MTALYMEVTGHGPPLVLLHGWALNLRVFDPLVSLLVEHFTVHAIDLPGHGRSPGPLLPEACTGNAGLLDIARRLLLQLPARFHLCGWSLGGMV